MSNGAVHCMGRLGHSTTSQANLQLSLFSSSSSNSNSSCCSNGSRVSSNKWAGSRFVSGMFALNHDLSALNSLGWVPAPPSLAGELRQGKIPLQEGPYMCVWEHMLCSCWRSHVVSAEL